MFVPMSRAAYHRSIFLDGRISPEGEGALRVPLATFQDTVARASRTGWVFHVAHCGSTLLARALDQPATNLILREPLALRQLALAPDQRRLALVAAMLGKRYRPEAPTIVKANVPVNFILPQLVALDPGAPAIFLYLDLRDYLLAILRSADHRAWVGRVTHQLGGYLGDLTGLGIGECAAALWLAQIRAYANALAALPNGRSLNAERFFADPPAVLAAAAAHFSVPMDTATVMAVADGPLFATYSKNPSLSFDNTDRIRRREELRSSLEEDMAAAQTWIERHGPDASSTLGKLADADLLR
ncbi:MULTISPECIES: hypothetical protein [unclassified Novosphingobium]|uniref:hypothetical protein n=1 Tax=unclassified Novosphingobium TaxID=2644732 RepID=UPI001359B5EF|nr:MULTISPECIES: hypothetical protein [unclassified Novosphingobium]